MVNFGGGKVGDWGFLMTVRVPGPLRMCSPRATTRMRDRRKSVDCASCTFIIFVHASVHVSIRVLSHVKRRVLRRFCTLMALSVNAHSHVTWQKVRIA